MIGTLRLVQQRRLRCRLEVCSMADQPSSPSGLRRIASSQCLRSVCCGSGDSRRGRSCLGLEGWAGVCLAPRHAADTSGRSLRRGSFRPWNLCKGTASLRTIAKSRRRGGQLRVLALDAGKQVMGNWLGEAPEILDGVVGALTAGWPMVAAPAGIARYRDYSQLIIKQM